MPSYGKLTFRIIKASWEMNNGNETTGEGQVDRVVMKNTAEADEILFAVKEKVTDGQLLTLDEYNNKQLQKHYEKSISLPLIVGLINNIEEHYPEKLFPEGAGAIARHTLKLLKQELILACNIEDSRVSS